MNNKEILLSGIEYLASVVGSTLGPNGKNVIINTDRGVRITKDGVTVASFINSENPIENAGIQIIKEAALKNATLVGDGTTTATVLASEFIKAGLDKEELENMWSLFDKTIQQYRNDNYTPYDVAYIASNGDDIISALVAEAFSRNDAGMITVEDGDSDYVEFVEGYSFDSGYVDPLFINKRSKYEASDVTIVLTPDKLMSAQNLMEVLPEDLSKPILLIVGDIAGEALQSVVLNKIKGNINICVVKIPGYGIYKQSAFEQLVALISHTTAPNKRYYGTAQKVIVNRDNFVLVQPDTDVDVLAQYSEALWEKVKQTTDQYEKDKYIKLYSGLSGSAAVIYLRSNNDIELNERKDRIDDAIHAVKAAKEGGVVPGAGFVFAKMAEQLVTYNNALSTPLNLIFKDTVPNEGVYQYLVSNNVLDPVKNLRVALETAISLTTLLHSTDYVINTVK
jgi:chaperonin GroEL